MDDLLKKFGVAKQRLACPISEEHRREIAINIGDEWESLATFIGVSDVDISDIKERYCNSDPRVKRLAMMRVWKQLHGRDATYFKLTEGLVQVGRRDIIETLLLSFESDDMVGYSVPFTAVATKVISLLVIIVLFNIIAIVCWMMLAQQKNPDYLNNTGNVDTKKQYYAFRLFMH